MIHLTGNFYGVAVPGLYKNFVVKNYGYATGQWLMETDSKELNHWKVFLSNGQGNYRFLFLRSQATEEQAKMVVEKGKVPCDLYYKDYTYKWNVIEKDNGMWDKVTAIQSLESLFQSKNLPGEVAVVEKIS